MSDATIDPLEIAVGYVHAVGNKEFSRFAEVLHPTFEGWTGGKSFDREAWITALRGFAPVLIRNDVRQTIVDRDQVCVVYDFVTDTATGVVPCVELIQIEDGLIRSSRLVFEFAHWPEVMAEIRRRTL